MAFEKFSRIPHAHDLRLFFNLDNRLLTSPAYSPKQTLQDLGEHQLQPSSVVLEVSERTHKNRGEEIYRILKEYQDSTIRVAVDDFGTGFSGLALLYDTYPEYMKIDRYFISNIGNDHKKKMFVSHLVRLAKTLGIIVVAEGVETESEFYTCREIGCDLVQGFLIQRPTVELGELHASYEIVTHMRDKDRRRHRAESRFVSEKLDSAPTMDVNMRMVDIFEAFRLNPSRSFFPFINDNKQPIGLVREIELKEYIYSPYGRDLLSRKRIGDHLDIFVRRCPVADINTPIDIILEQYSVSPSRDGVLITEDGRYIGVLSAESLILAVQERNLELARDQNPLTGLPGNPSIERFVAEHQGGSDPVEFLYFDLDNFKVFNDTYGFRMGDRALQMFAELLNKTFGRLQAFIGHIGGDDFFVGVPGGNFLAAYQAATQLIADFKSDAESLYSEEHRKAGHVSGLDRYGTPTDFQLLSASCAFLSVASQTQSRNEYAILSVITMLKKESKLTKNTVTAASLI